MEPTTRDRRAERIAGIAGIAGYGLALVATAAATALTTVLWPVLRPFTFSFYFLCLIPVGLYGGLRPALLTLFLSAVAQNFFFFEPRFAWATNPAAVTGQSIFLSVGLAISILTDRFRKERADAERQRRWFEGTLSSVGDAVIATDPEGRVTFMNGVAETLTGWPSREAVGRPLPEVFRIVDETTGTPVENPVERVFRTGRVVGLANHTVLITRDGRRIPIADSAAPIRTPDRDPDGAVLVFRDVSEQQKVEARAHAAERRSTTILESITDHFVSYDAEWRFTYVNAAAERSLGRSREELLGQVVWEVLPYVRGSAAEAPLRRAAAEHVTCEFESERGDTGRWFKGTVYPNPDGGVSVYYRESTDDRRAEQALRASEERLQLALRAGEVGIWDWDVHADRIVWSDRIYEIHGIDRETFPGTVEAFAMLVHPDDRTRVQEAIRRTLEEGGTYTLEFRAVRPSGEVRWLATRAQVLRDEHGRPQRMLGATLDITERHALMEELRHHAAELAEADRRKDEFLAMLAHELRNPLAPILNATQVLRQREVPDPVVERQRQVIERQVQHLARMVDDLLEVSRITRGKIALRREWLDLSEVIQQAVQTCSPLVEARRHHLVVNASVERVLIDGDRDRLVQVVVNLLNNAAKYTRPGGEIEVACRREGAAAVLSVRDSGEGLAPELLPRIFELFVQAEQSLDRAQGGLGIGLTMVKNLVEAHGGSVEAHSEGLGTGSTFRVRLPALPPQAAAARNEPVPLAGTGEHTPSQRVLIVEDNLDAAETLQELLALRGHDVRVVNSGPAALELLERNAAEVVLLDIGLPGMDGYEIAARIRALALTPRPTLIAVTGYARPEDRERSKAAGFDHHLSKPVDVDVLLALVEAGPPERAGSVAQPVTREVSGEALP